MRVAAYQPELIAAADVLNQTALVRRVTPDRRDLLARRDDLFAAIVIFSDLALRHAPIFSKLAVAVGHQILDFAIYRERIEACHVLKRRGSDVLVDARDIRSVDLLFRKKLELRKSEETDGSEAGVDDRGCEPEAGEVFHLAGVTVDAATFVFDVVAV